MCACSLKIALAKRVTFLLIKSKSQLSLNSVIQPAWTTRTRSTKKKVNLTGNTKFCFTLLIKLSKYCKDLSVNTPLLPSSAKHLFQCLKAHSLMRHVFTTSLSKRHICLTAPFLGTVSKYGFDHRIYDV